jgi:hypothetical protein
MRSCGTTIHRRNLKIFEHTLRGNSIAYPDFELQFFVLPLRNAEELFFFSHPGFNSVVDTNRSNGGSCPLLGTSRAVSDEWCQGSVRFIRYQCRPYYQFIEHDREVSQDIEERAFIGNERLRTLWLSTAHNQTPLPARRLENACGSALTSGS